MQQKRVVSDSTLIGIIVFNMVLACGINSWGNVVIASITLWILLMRRQ